MVTAADLLFTDFVKINANDVISAFLGAIKKKETTFALVFDGKSYVGFADKKALLRSRFDPAETKVKHAIKHVPLLSPSARLADIVRLLSAADTRALPVRDKNKIIGVVRAKDVVRELLDFYSDINIVDVLKKKLVVCSVGDELGKVIATMTRRNVDRMPVVDGAGKLVGVVSFVDVLSKLLVFPRKRMHPPGATGHNKWHATGFGLGEKQNLLKCPVGNVMTEICYSCNSDGRMADVIDVMGKNDVSSVIVINSERPVGIITLKDLLEFYRKKM